MYTLLEKGSSCKISDVLYIFLDGTSILGSSNMCTRYWAGILSVFHSPDDMTDQTKCQSSIEFEGGLSCAKFVSESKVICPILFIHVNFRLTK